MHASKRLLALAVIGSLISACQPYENGTTNNSGSNNENTTDGVTTSTEATAGLSSITLNTATISASGSTNLTVNIIDTSSNEVLVGSGETVSFTSYCADMGTASFDPATITPEMGRATVTYTANGCTGTDLILARLNGGASSTTQITISSPEFGSIKSLDPEFTHIFYRGDSGQTTSEVSFKVEDKSGNPIAGQTVNFELISGIGDTELLSTTATTNEQGIVKTEVQAGLVSSIVQVRASVSGQSGFTAVTESKGIAVSTGYPMQGHMTIGASPLNPEAWNKVGVTSELTVYLSDRWGNIVPDGTVVQFATQTGGTIVGECVTTDSVCSVTWVSGASQPTNGRVVIVARTIGEGDFRDQNGDGLFDPTTDGNGVNYWNTTTKRCDLTSSVYGYCSFPEAHVDVDSDYIRDANEEFFDYNDDGNFTDSTTADAYQGKRCTSAAITAGHCADMMEVRDYTTLILASKEIGAGTGFSAASVDASVSDQNVTVTVVDINGNVPPSGTSMSISCTDATYTTNLPNTVPNTSIASTYSLTIYNDTSLAGQAGSCSLTVNGLKRDILTVVN